MSNTNSVTVPINGAGPSDKDSTIRMDLTMKIDILEKGLNLRNTNRFNLVFTYKMNVPFIRIDKPT